LTTWRLVLSRRASTDLAAIYDWIAEEASETTADKYAERLERFCLRLTRYPKRAIVRNDLFPGVRLIGFEKSVTVVFVVDDSRNEVRVLRLLYRGQQLDL